MSVKERIEEQLGSHDVLLYMKGTPDFPQCGFSGQAVAALKAVGKPPTLLLSDEAAESFLGTQGYVWDTQSDMFYALLGATAALILLSRVHDRQLRDLGYA